MTTARVLVTDALALLGIAAAEEPLTAHQEQQGLRTLNSLIQSASLEQFLVYYTPPQVVLWPAGRMLLSWGLGSVDIPTPRPVQVSLQASYMDGVTEARYPLSVLTPEEWRMVPYPTRTGDPPQGVCYLPTMPLGTLGITPIPQTPVAVTVYPWTLLSTWPAFDDEVLLPPGYERWLRSALACDLAPFYATEPAPMVQGMRMEARENIKTANITIPTLETPWFADPYGPHAGTSAEIRSYPR